MPRFTCKNGDHPLPMLSVQNSVNGYLWGERPEESKSLLPTTQGFGLAGKGHPQSCQSPTQRVKVLGNTPREQVCQCLYPGLDQATQKCG